VRRSLRSDRRPQDPYRYNGILNAHADRLPYYTTWTSFLGTLVCYNQTIIKHSYYRIIILLIKGLILLKKGRWPRFYSVFVRQ